MPGEAKGKTAKPKRAQRAGRRKRVSKSTGLEPADCSIGVTHELAPVAERVEQDGGCMVASFRDPLGGKALIFAVLPIDAIQPTPFQRDLSDAHHKRLAEVIHKTGRFLDPVIAVPAPEGGFWTPNGYHRLEAMRRLGARSITALIIPDREVARQILALNTEKAHNLKERALEVFRIYRGLVEEQPAEPESSFAFYLEDPSLVTLGMIYDERRMFAGGAYHPVLRRVEEFSEEPIRTAMKVHARRAAKLAELEDRVAEIVAGLKERGLQSPYLRPFVVARINPLRWIKGDELPPAEKVLQSMLDRAAKFNVDKIRQQDLAGAYGATGDDE
ncbi:MAG TPA: ParB N-terminal domain-containing protein [Bryobacteraceae bacterium]|nr:ParB N-terminal domain-containing protein [Bryobacteraceae bacterium]